MALPGCSPGCSIAAQLIERINRKTKERNIDEKKDSDVLFIGNPPLLENVFWGANPKAIMGIPKQVVKNKTDTPIDMEVFLDAVEQRRRP
jgi:hypothetical protein